MSDTINSYTKTSFGNMGFTKATCGQSPIQYKPTGDHVEATTSLVFRCERTTTISNVISSGLLLDKDYGGEDNVVRQCAPKEDGYTKRDFNKDFPSVEFDK